MVFDRGFEDLPATAADTRIVHEGIQACALLPDHRHGGIDLVLLCHIQFYRGDVFDRIQLGKVLVLSSAGIHVVAVGRERLGEIAADARTRAGDQDGLLIVRIG